MIENNHRCWLDGQYITYGGRTPFVAMEVELGIEVLREISKQNRKQAK